MFRQIIKFTIGAILCHWDQGRHRTADMRVWNEIMNKL